MTHIEIIKFHKLTSKPQRHGWYILGSSRSLEYRAAGFEDGDRITFRVRAENKIGAGKPSKPSDFITLEDRYGNT